MRFKHLAFIPLMLVGIWDGQYLHVSPAEWDVTLTGNDSRCFGWLEIFHEENWKRIYSNSWKQQNAEVACKQLHCGPLLGMLNQTSLSPEKQVGCMIIGCQGNETTLKDCKPHKSNCTQYLNVAVFCQDPIKTSSDLLQTSAPLVTSSKTPDPPRTRLEDGTSLCSGKARLHLGDHWEMVCLGLQRWWTKLAPMDCQQANCDDATGIQDQGRMQQPEQWAKVQCEKMNLSLECLNRTKECLSVSLIKCTGQDAKPVSYTETILKILLGLVLTAVFLVICIPLTYKKLVKKYSKKQQHRWIGPNGVNQNVSFHRKSSSAFQPQPECQGVQDEEKAHIQGLKKNSYLSPYPALEGATHRSSNPLDYSSDSDYDLCSAQQL
ncbi:T-cell surface glycoprotein CD5 isoform X2 [Eublepharis macularius]|uniref:T-cell surface glycoprotein CD5 isoform X2 n=1 Tax=Eublepharis macularius TaxID=481883 RepID=A0AA97IZC2_EUBMA|nr:T-cell surface glycoprotein CD5 isoform X2 [Eublepharis macularius]